MGSRDLDRFDLIVVGCGPAGATAAREAAERGLSVMIVDRRRSVGMPPRCAGYVPAWLRTRTGFDDGAVLQTVEGIRVVDFRGGAREVRAPGHVLDRTRFDKTLAILALEAGADLANGLVLRREGGRVVLRRNGREADFTGDVVLGADGPCSVIGRSIGRGNSAFWATLQYEMGLRNPESWVEYSRTRKQGGACAWVVPCGRTVRVGVALPRSQARLLKARLAEFTRRLAEDGRVYPESVLGCSGGLVPANGVLHPVRSAGVLLAGDAGGMSDFSSRSGIPSAVVAGEVAGRIVGEAVSGGRWAILDDYGSEVRRRLPPESGPGAGSFELLVEHLERLAEWRG